MGQEKIQLFHRWSVILGVAGACGLAVVLLLFWKFRYGAWWREQFKNRRKNRKRARDGTALFLAAAFLIPPAASLAAEVSVLPDPAQEENASAGRVAVAVEGDSVRDGVYRDTAVAEFTFAEKNFDENGISVTVGDETGRETRITFENGGWKGLDGLGEGLLEAVPYEEGRWFLDSEEGKPEHTGERTVKMRLRFPAEGRFEIREAVCRDLAGNTSGLSEPVSVIIDRTSPVFRIVLPEEAVVHEGYYSHPITVWLYLKEHNFRPEETEELPQILLETVGSGADGGEGQPENRESDGEGSKKADGKSLITEGSWAAAPEEGEDWYKLPVTVAEEGNYVLRVFYEDPAGWPLSPESGTEQEFTVDMTPPEFGMVTVMGESWHAFMEHITFGHYSSGEELATFAGGDSISAVEPLRYYCSEREMTQRELSELAEEQWKEGNSLLLKPDLKAVVYLKVTNYAGLSSYFNSEGLVIEDKGPQITLLPQGNAWAESGIYREDVELKLVLEEPEETGVASGLKRAGYVLEAERDGKRELLKEETLFEREASEGGALKSWQDSLLLTAEEYDGEILWFTVLAEDMAGNRSEKSLCLSIDQTAPKLKIIYGEEQPENGSYYAQERRVRLMVEEANFSEERVWLLIRNSDGVLPEISGWSHDGKIHSCQILFSGDGDYTFSVRCEDLAGHRTEQTEKGFTVDRTPPKVTVTFTEEGQEGKGRYYRAPRTAEIIVEEHNFSEEQVTGGAAALLDRGESRSWELPEFDSRGDIHTVSLVFSEDGDYRFLTGCADLAGNLAAVLPAEEFSIDSMPPAIEIFGLEDESANRGAVEAKIRVSDKRLVPESVRVKVSRLDQRGTETACQYQEVREAEGCVTKLLLPESFPETEEADGLYLLRAEGRDLAGNRTEEELTFSVNRYGSVYAAAGETKRWLTAGEYPYLSEEREVVIREYNVDPVEDVQAAVSRNGEFFLLQEGKHFRREQLQKVNFGPQWQVYEYRIQKELFEREGDYEILIYSEDRAGNKMGNKSVRQEELAAVFSFSIDKTGPSAVLSGGEDGGRYRRDRLEVFLDIRDNMLLRRVEVRTKDGKRCYEGEDLERISSEEGLEVVLSEADDWQSLELYAEDEAGNRLELGNGHETGAEGCMEWDFLVTADWWIQLYEDPVPLILFLAFAAGLPAAGLWGSMKWRRKKRKNPSEAPDRSQTKAFMVE